MEQDQVTLTFFKGRDGKIISRNTNGKICLLDINYCRQNRIYINDNEDWRCAIREERENCIIVQPITRTMTAEQNEEFNRLRLREKFPGGKKEVRAPGKPQTGSKPGPVKSE